MKKPPKGMKYARQKNEMPVAGNETLAWVSHFITHLGGNRKLCRQLPRVYHISGRYPSSISDYSSDSEEDDLAICDVSVPIKSKHLVWHCQVHRLTNDFPVKTCTLIDNGAHLVLIRPELIAELNLKKHHLHMPEPVDVALKNGQNS